MRASASMERLRGILSAVSLSDFAAPPDREPWLCCAASNVLFEDSRTEELTLHRAEDARA